MHARGRLGAALGLVLAALGCQRPMEVEPVLVLRAASVDSTHVDLGFPESLDPVAMTDPANYRVWIRGTPDAPVRIRSIAVSDTIRGRSVRLETDPVPDQLLVAVRVESVRLVTGTRLGDEPLTTELVTGLSYGKDIAPLFARHCNSCHSGDTPDGNYLTDDYFALFGSGVAPPGNLLPGNEASLLVRKTLPGASMFWTGGLETIEGEMIRNWVVVYLARQ